MACSYEYIFSSTILLMSCYLSYTGGRFCTLELVMNSVMVKCVQILELLGSRTLTLY